MCKATIYDARNSFSSLVKIAEGGEPVELTRHEKPVAVIISYDEYEKLTKPKESFVEKIAKLKEKFADDLEGFDGIPIPEDEYPDEEYLKKIDSIWSED